MKLFIAEKPSLARAIAAGIGTGKSADGYISLNGGNEVVTWCFGHILEQLNPSEYDEKYQKWRMEDLPIVPSHWKLKVKSDAAKQFKIVRDLISKATTIVNAGDPDREGQLLVDEVLDFVGNKKPVQRILLNALDEKSVRQSLNNLQDNKNFQGLKNAALGRSRADWLVGMNLSRAYTIKARQAGYENISVGRVMTPTMALVVRREEEITKFQPVTHYVVKAIFKNNLGDIPTTWQMSDKIQKLDSEGRLLDKKVAEDFLEKFNSVTTQGKIISVEEKNKSESQRLPYSLSSLQIEAGKKFSYSPQMVLDTMQSLYEKKLTTYPRSDCEFLPENQFDDAVEILAHLKNLPNKNFSELVKCADLKIKSRAWNDKKISAHHAIIPTRISADFEKLNEVEQNLYLMVAQSYLAQFYPPHEFKSTKIKICFDDEKFVGKGKQIIKLGWKEIYKNFIHDDEEIETNLPPVHEGESVKYISGKIVEKTTKPPTKFTPSTLLQAMKEIYKYVRNDTLKAELKECSGIGTEATRAGIIEKLQSAGFLKLAGKFFEPTEKARMAVKILPDEMIYPDTTAVWEKELEEVAAGYESFDKFYLGQLQSLSALLDKAKTSEIIPSENSVLCPSCGKLMIRRKGKNGYFWGCSDFPECKTTARDNKGKPDFSTKKK